MNYKQAIKQSMEMLAKDKNTLFLGYNICFGSKAYGTLSDIPKEQKIETPVAENLMMDLAIGLSLEGYRLVVFFERQDFILNGLDAIVNHLDKIESMSKGEFKTPVIIRATVGTTKPFHPGCQHIQNFTEPLKQMIKFPIYEPKTKEIIPLYEKLKETNHPAMVVEKREDYAKN